METFASILQILGIIIILASLVVCFFNFLGIPGTIIGFALCGLSEFIHIDDKAKIQLAEETYKADGELLIIKSHRETLGTLHEAAAEIQRNIGKIQQIAGVLEQKSGNVSNESSKKIFSNKIESLMRQKGKLEQSLHKLESCAFEQALVNYTEELAGPLEKTSITASIHEELEAVRKVMKEVEQINQH